MYAAALYCEMIRLVAIPAITFAALAYATLITIVTAWLIISDFESSWFDRIIDIIITIIFFILIVFVYDSTKTGMVNNDLSVELSVTLAILSTLSPFSRKSGKKYRQLSNQNEVLSDCLDVNESFNLVCALLTNKSYNVELEVKYIHLANKYDQLAKHCKKLGKSEEQGTNISAKVRKGIHNFIDSLCNTNESRKNTKILQDKIIIARRKVFFGLDQIIKLLDGIGENSTSDRLLKDHTNNEKLKLDLQKANNR